MRIALVCVLVVSLSVQGSSLKFRFPWQKRSKSRKTKTSNTLIKLTFLPIKMHPNAVHSAIPLRKPIYQSQSNAHIFTYLKVLLLSNLLAAALIIRHYLLMKKSHEKEKSPVEHVQLTLENIQENDVSVHYYDVYSGVRSAKIQSFPSDGDLSKEPSINSSDSGITSSHASSDDRSPADFYMLSSNSGNKSSNSFDFGDVYGPDNADRISTFSGDDDELLRAVTTTETIESDANFIVPEETEVSKLQGKKSSKSLNSRSNSRCWSTSIGQESPLICSDKVYPIAADAKIENFYESGDDFRDWSMGSSVYPDYCNNTETDEILETNTRMSGGDGYDCSSKRSDNDSLVAPLSPSQTGSALWNSFRPLRRRSSLQAIIAADSVGHEGDHYEKCV